MALDREPSFGVGQVLDAADDNGHALERAVVRVKNLTTDRFRPGDARRLRSALDGLGSTLHRPGPALDRTPDVVRNRTRSWHWYRASHGRRARRLRRQQQGVTAQNRNGQKSDGVAAVGQITSALRRS